MANTEAIEVVSQKIETALTEYGVSGIAKLPTILQAVRMAQGIRALREALSDQFMATVIMPLVGSKLGFVTDRDREPTPYPLAVVRDCTIEALLRGFRVVGNEFNIISGSFYVTRGGFERVVQEFPGLSHLVMQPGVPMLSQDKGGALVPYTATWRLNGEPASIVCQYVKEGEQVTDQRIPVRVNGGMGADAILGKAQRKMYYRIYQRLVGGTYGAVDGDISDAIDTTGEPAQIAAPSPVPAGTPEGQRVKLPGKGAKDKPAAATTAGPAAPEYGNIELPGSAQ